MSNPGRDLVNKRWHPDEGAKAKRRTKIPTDGPSVVLRTIEDYDKQLGLPENWQDAVKREALVAELLANETKRGALMTREQVAERERAYDDLVMGALAAIPERMAELVPADVRNEARRIGRELIAEIRRGVAAAITAHGKVRP